MSNFKKKVVVVLFTGLIFTLAVYFNCYYAYSLNRTEIKGFLSGNISASDFVSVAVDTVQGYYEKIVLDKSEVTKPANTVPFIETYGLTQEVFGNALMISKIPGETVFKTRDDRLILEKLHGVYTYSDQMKSLKSFSQWLESKDIDFFVAHAPTKEVEDDEYPSGMGQEKNVNDCIVDSLLENGIPYVDFRKNPEISKDSSDWHYRTDHHWNAETAFLSAQYLVRELNRDFGYGLDESILNFENFNCEVHEKAFLGSAGKKTGISFAGTDDFKFYLPKSSDTDFSVEVTVSNDKIEQKQGSFEDVFIARKHLGQDYYKGIMYTTFMNGDYGYQIIKNNNAVTDKRIVVIKDSYANAMVPYLAMVTKEIVMIDPRWYEDSMQNYIEDYNPDAVVLVYNPGAYLEEVFFDFE